MEYSKEFIELVKYCSENKLYIGTGNPNAKILIIGKECAMDRNTPLGEEGYQREIVNNPSDWNKNIKDNIVNFDNIPMWISWNNDKPNFPNTSNAIYNPLFPYKGQCFITERHSTENKEQIIGGKGGTSSTWYWYQRLLNEITGKSGKYIDFHKHCFITELNEVCGNYSRDIPKNGRENSIEKRKLLLSEDFFQQFPIVIVATGHYPRDFGINLEELFRVDYVKDESEEKSGKVGKYWMNIHRNRTLHKLLIHTNQLSMPSKELISAIAEECKVIYAE